VNPYGVTYIAAGKKIIEKSAGSRPAKRFLNCPSIYLVYSLCTYKTVAREERKIIQFTSSKGVKARN